MPPVLATLATSRCTVALLTRTPSQSLPKSFQRVALGAMLAHLYRKARARRAATRWTACDKLHLVVSTQLRCNCRAPAVQFVYRLLARCSTCSVAVHAIQRSNAMEVTIDASTAKERAGSEPILNALVIAGCIGVPRAS